MYGEFGSKNAVPYRKSILTKFENSIRYSNILT